MVEFRNSVGSIGGTRSGTVSGGIERLCLGAQVDRGDASKYGIDPARIIVGGESGGGNLTLATGLKLKRDGDLALVKGLYALCPYIAGRWPDGPLSIDRREQRNPPELARQRGAMGYGIEAFEAGDPLAWPVCDQSKSERFPTDGNQLNECDPLRDEGIAFYRLLLSSGVAARGRTVLGTSHGYRDLPARVPDIKPQHGRRHRGVRTRVSTAQFSSQRDDRRSLGVQMPRRYQVAMSSRSRETRHVTVRSHTLRSGSSQFTRAQFTLLA